MPGNTVKTFFKVLQLGEKKLETQTYFVTLRARDEVYYVIMNMRVRK